MYCPHCGTQTRTAACSVCGYVPAVSVAGLLDPLTGLTFAGFWRRAGSRLADVVLLIIPLIIVVALFARFGDDVALAASIALEGLYVIWFLTRPAGQTIGCALASVRVRDATSGGAISVRQVSRRWGLITAYGALELLGHPFAYAVIAISLVDNLYQLIDPRRQTLHDKFAHTIVVGA